MIISLIGNIIYHSECTAVLRTRYIIFNMGATKSMSAYELGSDEAVIMQDFQVLEGNKNITLILTNQNIIQVSKVSKGLWSTEEQAVKYPLLELKELNGKPNIIMGKDKYGKTQLELYFSGYEKYYLFQSKIAERKWAGAIEKAYRTCVAEQRKKDKEKAGAGAIFAPLRGTMESVKHAVAPKSKGVKTVKCPRCGAELTGEKGQDVTCRFCETVVKIK